MLTNYIINKMNEDELRNHVCQYSKLIDELDILNGVHDEIEDTLCTYLRKTKTRECLHNKIAEAQKRINDIEVDLYKKYGPTPAPFQAANAEGCSNNGGADQ